MGSYTKISLIIILFQKNLRSIEWFEPENNRTTVNVLIPNQIHSLSQLPTKQTMILPKEILSQILSYGSNDYLFTGTVCKDWHEATGSERYTSIENSTTSLALAKEIDVKEEDQVYPMVFLLAMSSHGSCIDALKVLKDMGYNLHGRHSFYLAARVGNLDVLKWLKEIGCPMCAKTFREAVSQGSLENMKWIRENESPYRKCNNISVGIIGGNVEENTNWLEENGYKIIPDYKMT